MQEDRSVCGWVVRVARESGEGGVGERQVFRLRRSLRASPPVGPLRSGDQGILHVLLSLHT